MKNKRGWFYRNFICSHVLTGQIKADNKFKKSGMGYKRVHYRECPKCGKKFYTD